jgi:hypothetical protein
MKRATSVSSLSRPTIPAEIIPDPKRTFGAALVKSPFTVTAPILTPPGIAGTQPPELDHRLVRCGRHPLVCRRSALVRWDVPQPVGKGGDLAFGIGGTVAHGGRRTLGQRQARPPFVRRTDGTWCEAAATVRTHVEQLGVYAVRAERALVGANARRCRLWRQVDVAVLAVRS